MTQVTVVCGPPGSGKTTYVRERMKWGDLVVDVDALYGAISGCQDHEHPRGLLLFALAARDALYRRVELERNGLRHVWVITGGAKQAERQRLRNRLNARVVVLETGLNECLRRIQADDRRKTRWETWQPLVERWWKDYRRDEGEEQV